MAVTAAASRRTAVHPLYTFLVAGAVPLFLGGLLSDLAYGSSVEIQWSNFAAWLIAGAMVLTGCALLWALIDLIRAGTRRPRALLSFILLIFLFVIGLIDSFVHARDAWAIMPAAPVLSAIATVIAAVVAVAAFSPSRSAAAG